MHRYSRVIALLAVLRQYGRGATRQYLHESLTSGGGRHSGAGKAAGAGGLRVGQAVDIN
jgi:hypothetical protein